MEKKIKIHKAITGGPDLKINEIAKLMKDNNDRRVFIVDSKNKILGIVTTVDLTYKILALGKGNLTAKDIMTRDVKFIEHNDDLEKALEVMNSTNSYVCPVVENDKFIGVVSHHDIMAFILGNK